ncbi:S-layer homology domain-containing protein [Cohnella caldifontis]
MQQHGLIAGRNANRFDPSGKVTRAEAVTVLLKLSDAKSGS